MRYDAEHKERTRALLLKEAARAIRDEGPERIGVAAIMGKAGLTHGGFYAYFQSKDDLVAQAIDAMFEESEQRLQKVLANRAPSEVLARYIEVYLSPAHRDGRSRGCPVAALSADAPHLPQEARQAFANGIDRLRELLAGRLAALGDAQPQQSATSMLAEMSGAIALARCMGDGEASDEVLAASRAAIKQRYGLASYQGN